MIDMEIDFNSLRVPVDYDSPIFTAVREMQQKFVENLDDEVMECVLKCGIDIDKDKLVQCLQQDKERYSEAYRRGYSAREREIIHCKDCKYCGGTIKRCANQNSPCWIMRVTDDFFCGGAERKEDDDGEV